MRFSLVLSLLVSSFAAFAAETPEPDFDSLGGNKILLERARALEPEKKVSIVQQRVVDRRKRFEISPEFSATFGGETYTFTKNVGINVNYHITPRFSIGAKYNYSFNTLTDEGQALINKAEADFKKNPGNPTAGYPKLDYSNQEYMGLLNWYPIYGKLNFFDRNVVHFDIYTLAGYGQIQLNSGVTDTYTAGGGVGFWLNPNLSTRFEMRWQRYTAQYFTGSQDLDLTIGSMQMGWML